MNNFYENLDLQAKGLWLPIVVGSLLLLFMLFSRKRLSWREIFFVWMTIGFLGWMNNTIVAVLFDLLNFGDPEKRGLPEIINYTIIPPAVSIIFLNYYIPDRKWIYAILFSVITVIYEWGLVQVGLIILTGWQTWWSIPVYLVMFGMVIPWTLRALRNENANNDGSNREFNLNLGREKAR